MDIKKITTYNQPPTAKPGQVEQKPDQGRLLSLKDTNGQPNTDRLEFSEHYRELSKVRQMASEKDDVRAERVQQVRRLIDQESLAIEPETIALRMLEELW